MSKEFIPKYSYFTNNKDVVVAVTTYHQKKVRGIAKCNPEDVFDLEKGKKLAKARCDAKVADLKVKRMIKLSNIFNEGMISDWEKSKKFHNYAVSAMEERRKAEKEIQEILKGL